MTKHFVAPGQNIIASCDHLRDILNSVLNSRVCKGVPGFKNVNACPGAVKSSERWTSTICEIVSASVVCIPCKLICQRLTKRLHLIKSRSPPKRFIPPGRQTIQMNEIRKTNRYYRRRIQVLRKQRNSLRTQLMNLKSSLQQLKTSKLTSDLKEMNLPSGMKCTILEAVSLAQKKSSKGMRYSSLINFRSARQLLLNSFSCL